MNLFQVSIRYRVVASLARARLFSLAVFPCAGGGMLTPRSDWSSHMIARLIGERSEPLSRVFNDQQRGIYMVETVRTYVRF